MNSFAWHTDLSRKVAKLIKSTVLLVTLRQNFKINLFFLLIINLWLDKFIRCCDFFQEMKPRCSNKGSSILGLIVARKFIQCISLIHA